MGLQQEPGRSPALEGLIQFSFTTHEVPATTHQTGSPSREKRSRRKLTLSSSRDPASDATVMFASNLVPSGCSARAGGLILRSWSLSGRSVKVVARRFVGGGVKSMALCAFLALTSGCAARQRAYERTLEQCSHSGDAS